MAQSHRQSNSQRSRTVEIISFGINGGTHHENQQKGDDGFDDEGEDRRHVVSRHRDPEGTSGNVVHFLWNHGVDQSSAGSTTSNLHEV